MPRNPGRFLMQGVDAISAAATYGGTDDPTASWRKSEKDPAEAFRKFSDVAWHVLKGIDLLSIYAANGSVK